MSDDAGTGAPPDPAEIDWARVRELKQEIGAEDFAEVVELFLSETEAMIDALAGQDPGQYEEALHSLKGAALNLGLAGLAALCFRGERLAAEGRAAEVQVAPVLTAYAAARAAFLSGIAEGRAG
jgi:HPt (histidine-containing phosphotransfer) domain-containing protein